MARKRGRPPKTPSFSSKKTPEKQDHCDDIHGGLDLSLSDEDTLEAIDNLSPKKAEEMLKNLEVLKDRIKKKIPTEKTPEKEGVSCDNDGVIQAKLQKAGEETVNVDLKQTKVKQQWVEKVKPTREDTEQIDDALRSKDEMAVDSAVAKANGLVDKSKYVDTVVGASVSDAGAASASSTDAKEGATETTGANGKDKEQVADSEENVWTTVITRSKAQVSF
ncbi:hypothetical protein RIF29_29604 [Crotalaria pallida]|uniref:Uncharacterized protein n=1 Tax=Crotalaria pallida TaxID=3830 RepID=A0AAN9EF24_CROPI